MALQENNLMLLDVDGFPRTIDGATDSIGISTDLIIGGDLTVNGDIVSGGTMDVVVSDNFIDLSNGNITGAKSGGLTVNVQANANTNMAAGTGVTFQSVADAAGAFATLSINGFTAAGQLAVNDIIEISGLSDLGENSGLFTVQSVAAGAGGLVEIKNANAASVPFCQTNFESGTEDAGILAWDLDIGVITISDGSLPTGVGGGTIAKGNFATAYAADANDQATGPTGFTYGDAASVSLQEAYDEGQLIQISNLGDLIIKTDEATPKDFIVAQGGTAFQYLQTDAASDTLKLGAMNGVNPAIKVQVVGELSSDLAFDAAQSYSIRNMDTNGTVMNDLTVEGASLDLGSMSTTVGKRLNVFAQGLGDTSSLTANNAYVGNASVAGDLVGSIRDVNGVDSVLTVTFGAAALDVAALIAGATVVPGGAVVLSDDGGGKLKITSAAVGFRVSFNFDTESVAGVAAAVGIAALPAAASNGQPAASLRADNAAGDVGILAGRHIGLMSNAGSLELRTQAGGQEISLQAQGGTLSLAGDTNANLTSNGGVNIQSTTAVDIDGLAVSIDGGFGAGVGLGSINIGANKRVATQIDALALGLDSSAAITIAADASSSMSVAGDGNTLTLQAQGGLAAQLIASSAGTGVDAIQITASAGGTEIKSTVGISLLQGVGATLDSTGVGTALIKSNADITLQAGAAATAIQLKGWVQQDYTSSAGMGVQVTLRTSGGLPSVAGEMFAFKNDGAANEAMSVNAASPEAPGVCGAFLETGIVAGQDIKAHTVQGAVVTLSFDGGGNPGVGAVGTPVYLSSTLGKASIAATQVSGEHVIRLGFAMEASTGRVLWAPQYIAKRP